MSDALPYRDFYYPLNVFMHILTHEEGEPTALHYGLFERPDEPLKAAQERSTRMLLERLPPPPARLLDVGFGLGTTLRRLLDLGYEAEGITPDEKQIAMAQARFGESFPIRCAAFESFEPGTTYDAILFQESSQYIDSHALFARAATLAPLVVVVDEFALVPMDTPGALHSRSGFLESAGLHGFEIVEEKDVSAMAPPTITYFMTRLPRYRSRLVADLGLTDQQVDDLVTSGEAYVERYRMGAYGYRVMVFRRF